METCVYGVIEPLAERTHSIQVLVIFGDQDVFSCESLDDTDAAQDLFQEGICLAIGFGDPALDLLPKCCHSSED